MKTQMPNPFINPDYRPEPDLEALEIEIMSILPQLNGAVEEASPVFLSDPSPAFLGIVETLAEFM